MENKKESLNLVELKKWGVNLLVFSSPTLLAFLFAVQSGKGFEVAQFMAYQALLASLIDLLVKFKQGV